MSLKVRAPHPATPTTTPATPTTTNNPPLISNVMKYGNSLDPGLKSSYPNGSFLQNFDPTATTICIHDWLCLEFLIACVFNLQMGGEGGWVGGGVQFTSVRGQNDSVSISANELLTKGGQKNPKICYT